MALTPSETKAVEDLKLYCNITRLRELINSRIQLESEAEKEDIHFLNLFLETLSAKSWTPIDSNA